MPNLVQNIPISHNSNDLHTYDHENLCDVDWRQIAITDCKHGGEGKVKGVYVLFDGRKLVKIICFEPVVLFVE